MAGGRRIQGRTFLVPLVASAFDSTGTISTAALATLQTAANGLVAYDTIDPVVWKRPTPFTVGSFATITEARIPDMAAVLRSRRQ